MAVFPRKFKPVFEEDKADPYWTVEWQFSGHRAAQCEQTCFWEDVCDHNESTSRKSQMQFFHLKKKCREKEKRGKTYKEHI